MFIAHGDMSAMDAMAMDAMVMDAMDNGERSFMP